jgi:signal transduction histidine kinase
MAATAPQRDGLMFEYNVSPKVVHRGETWQRDSTLFAGMKILIVDDEPRNVALLEALLVESGYTRFKSIVDSRLALEACKTFDPDLILLDLMMPQPDGFAILESLRSEHGETFLPVVVLTANATPETKRRALRAGATDFLTKPFDHNEVMLRVRNLMRTRQLNLQVRAQNENLEQTVAERTAELQKALKQLKETQQQIIQQERLHAFGTMAGGVAHDFNNALSVILGFSEVALRECEGKMEAKSQRYYLHNIVTAALDGAKMVTRLREFYRPDDVREPRVAVNLNELIEQAVIITRPKWKTQSLGNGVKIEVRTELAEIAPVAADAAELREALTNLIFNAVDAMPLGGTITIRSIEEGENVTMEVADTGEGMSEEVRRRCLEPFFTTKGQLGTGLGLAMVYGIVDRHGGTLDVQNTQGGGTTFVISLPKYTGAEHVASTDTAAVTRPLHVLVADDQPLLCEILAEFLTNDCHTVVTAKNGREALEKFEDDRFDLVITDRVMPEMTGDQLADVIKTQSPSTPVILVTGYGQTLGGGIGEFDYVLNKPVSVIDLRHAVVRVTTEDNAQSAPKSQPTATIKQASAN